MFDRTEVQVISREAIDALIANDVLAVRIPDFASDPEIKALASALSQDAVRTNSIPSVTRLGISQFEQGVRGSKQEYFATARELEPRFARIHGASFSPVTRFMDTLRKLGFDVAVMNEPGFGTYWAGNGKLRTGTTPIHIDFAPQDSQGWAVARVTAQLAWNVYLECEPEDELLIWDKHWSVEHDTHMVDGEYFYHPAVVAGVEPVTIPPVPGEVIVINSRNYHSVARCDHRLAYGSFVGALDANTLRLWS